MAGENGSGNIPKAHFLRRRDHWIRWVLESDLPMASRVVGVHLAMRMNMRDQIAWPNVKTMARMLGLSDRQVRRCIRDVEEFGALGVKRFSGKGSQYFLRFADDP